MQADHKRKDKTHPKRHPKRKRAQEAMHAEEAMPAEEAHGTAAKKQRAQEVMQAEEALQAEQAISAREDTGTAATSMKANHDKGYWTYRESHGVGFRGGAWALKGWWEHWVREAQAEEADDSDEEEWVAEEAEEAATTKKNGVPGEERWAYRKVHGGGWALRGWWEHWERMTRPRW